jgi:ATP-dependent DNA helicase PIF1
VFFTGSAGVGKSFLLKYLIEHVLGGSSVSSSSSSSSRSSSAAAALAYDGYRSGYGSGGGRGGGGGAVAFSSVAVTASTGLAAVGIGGTTLHSWAGIGLGKEPADVLASKLRGNRTTAARWRSTRVLVIDEISMIGAPLFDKLEYIARQLCDANRPFG